MPGLLQSDSSTRSRLIAAVAAEFLATFLFALIGAAAPSKKAAWANGIALVVLIYVTANVSGGHLNPAVTIATMTTGHISISRGLAYICAQVSGATVASAILKLLLPAKAAGQVGCFGPQMGATLGQAFGWEVLMTLTLVLVIYSCAVGEPSFGVAGPAAIGLALSACALTSGPYTGASLNPARTLGPALVSGCGPNTWSNASTYIFAEILGAVAAAVASWPLYGTGLQFGKLWDAVEGAVDDAKEALRGGYRRLEGAAQGSQA